MEKTALLFLLFGALIVRGQSTCGIVFDKHSGERLTGVNFRELETGMGRVSDNNGAFCIETNVNTIWLVSYIGYKTDTLTFTDIPPGPLKVYLEPVAFELSAIEVVQGFVRTNFLRGMTKINAKELDKVPAFLGEKDLVKTITTKAGISPGSEGFATFSVRGGGTEHNLFILDGAPIYNSGHLFNFISVFNPDAVKSLTLYKGYYPPRYGGRLASVVDVNFRDGNSRETEISAEIGLINSKLTIEGPIGKNEKSSFMIAARSTYLDLFKHRKLKRIEKTPIGSFNSESDFGYTFADLNVKFNHTFNSRNRLFVSLYSGIDSYRTRETRYISKSDFVMNRQNMLLSVKSLHHISNKLYVEIIGSATNHSNALKSKEHSYWHETFIDTTTMRFFNLFHINSIIEDKSYNRITDFSAEGHFTLKTSTNSLLKGGMSFFQHTFSPANYFKAVTDTSGIFPETRLEGNKPRSVEPSAYIDLEANISAKLTLLAGLRLSGFFAEGIHYLRPEPRVSLGYQTGKAGIFAASFSVMQQYKHALMKNEQLMQNIVWVPSSDLLKPQQSMEYGLSHMIFISNRPYKIETGVYYKKMKDLVYFTASHVDSYAFFNWENKLDYNGVGQGYGLEFSIEKIKGNVTGAANYTYSKHERRFPNVNNGQRFPFRFNRTHEFNLSGNMKVSENWAIGMFWTISSGIRINVPNGYVNDNPFTFGYYTYSGLNNGRLPTYHRLDLSAGWEKHLKNKQRIGVNFSIYNAYNKHNSNYIYVDDKEIVNDKNEVIGYKSVVKSISLIPFLPSVNVSFKFK